jgi:hypothetical protein
LAIASSEAASAIGVVSKVSGDYIIIGGLVATISYETGITPTAGDLLYTSQTEAGKATNVKPASGVVQCIGKYLNATNINIEEYIQL